MPVFEKNKCRILFVHIPKCGGSSIEAAFRDAGFYMHFHDQGPTKPNSINSFCLSSPQHMCRDQYEMIFRLEAFDDCFSLVRHPLNRFLSEFAMRNSSMANPTESDVESFFDRSVQRFQNNSYYLDNHIRPQVDFISEKVKLFKLEDSMLEVVQYFRNEFGLELNIGNKLNSTALKVGRSAKLPVSETLRSKIYEFYKSDFDAFGYE